MDPKKYINKIEDSYKQLFGCMPNKNFRSPLADGDHPKLDTSEFLDEDDIQKYQSLVGAMQWAVSIGIFDIQIAVMSMSSFQAQPRKGHREQVKQIYGHLSRFKHFKICFQVEEPDMSKFDNKMKFDWSSTVYDNPTEELPTDALELLGKCVTLTHYFDANLMHDVLSDKAVTGCLHMANKPPMIWYSKEQATSETATYGSEFVSGRTCVEQVVDLRNLPVSQSSDQRH